jgi:hypothetical protein
VQPPIADRKHPHRAHDHCSCRIHPDCRATHGSKSKPATSIAICAVLSRTTPSLTNAYVKHAGGNLLYRIVLGMPLRPDTRSGSSDRLGISAGGRNREAPHRAEGHASPDFRATVGELAAILDAQLILDLDVLGTDATPTAANDDDARSATLAAHWLMLANYAVKGNSR